MLELNVTELTLDEQNDILGGVNKEGFWYNLSYGVYTLIHDVPELFTKLA